MRKPLSQFRLPLLSDQRSALISKVCFSESDRGKSERYTAVLYAMSSLSSHSPRPPCLLSHFVYVRTEALAATLSSPRSPGDCQAANQRRVPFWHPARGLMQRERDAAHTRTLSDRGTAALLDGYTPAWPRTGKTAPRDLLLNQTTPRVRKMLVFSSLTHLDMLCIALTATLWRVASLLSCLFSVLEYSAKVINQDFCYLHELSGLFVWKETW